MATHDFVPDRWHTTLGPHEPALRLADGDTVATTTVDGAGHDERGAKVAGFPNPQTGPFFIEGAEPGDTLAVQLDRLWLTDFRNYRDALSAALMISNDRIFSKNASMLLIYKDE